MRDGQRIMKSTTDLTPLTDPKQPDPSSPWRSRSQAAQYIGVPEATLAAWAYRGEGPRFRKVGKYCRYLQADIDTWIASRPAGGESRRSA